MVKLLDLLKENKPAISLFNIQFDVNGWEGPFSDVNEFRHVSKQLEKIKSARAFIVANNGILTHGTKEGLHTFYGEIDLRESYLHFHYSSGMADRIVKEGDDLVLEYLAINKKNGVESSPRYTLDKLYSTLSNEKMSTKIGALREALQQHANYRSESIAKRKNTRLKLLENAYRRKVSDQ